MNSIGHFITVEGIDGAGKSTLAQGLEEWMCQTLRLPTVRITEPYGYTHAQNELQIRTAHLALSALDRSSIQDRQASYFLFMANRALINVQKELNEGFNVILDRYIDSTVAYHQDVDPTGGLTHVIHNQFHLPMPHITFMVLCDVNVALERIQRRDGPINVESVASKLAAVQRVYAERAAHDPVRIFIIDGADGANANLELAKRVLARRFRWHEAQYADLPPSHRDWKKMRHTTSM